MPLYPTYTDLNFTGLESVNSYTGYTWDETLQLYFAQYRFYDPELKRFTSEDILKDGNNWYVYVGNNPLTSIDLYYFLFLSVPYTHLHIQARWLQPKPSWKKRNAKI